MRTGATFARGSCRALKWMALFGVVFVLGVGTAAAQVTVTVADKVNEGATVTLTVGGTVSIDAGASAGTLTVTAAAAEGPASGTVTAGESNDFGGFSIASIRTPSNSGGAALPHTVSGSFNWVVGTDIDAEDEAISLTYTVTPPSGVTGAGTPAAKAVTIDDSHMQMFEWGPVPTLKEAGSAMITLTANPTPTSGGLTHPTALAVEGATGYTITPNSHEFDNANPSVTLTITAPTDDDNQTNDTIRVRALESGTVRDRNNPLSITVADNNVAPPPALRGQLTDLELVYGSSGAGVEKKRIGGRERYHVTEGSEDIVLKGTARWRYDELDHIFGTFQRVDVAIRSDRPRPLPSWLSWIDAEGDVHLPSVRGAEGGLKGTLWFWIPRKNQFPRSSPFGSDRDSWTTDNITSRQPLSVLILHDNHEAENDAFYIQAIGGNLELGAVGAVDSITEVVIEDDESQLVRIRSSSLSVGPTNVYEPAGDATILDPVFTVDAVPARVDLPLEVRLDMVDLDDQTVSAAKISLAKASMTLNDPTTGTGNADTVTVHLPDSDGDRVDDYYKLNASVNVYSVATGGYRTIPVAEHSIKVIDRHKLPDLTVSPPTVTVKEGEKTKLTLTINRNPSNTTVGSNVPGVGERLQYTQEEVTVMLSRGNRSTAGNSDYSVMTNPVTFPERTRGSFTASMTVEVEATADNELDDMEMLVLDAEVSGAVAVNGTDNTTYPGGSTLTIEESTAKLVYPKTDEEIQTIIYAAKEAGMGGDMMFNPGEMIEIESAGALFNATEGVTLSYSAMSDNEDVATVMVSGAMVTVTAEGLPGVMAHITITAHASMPAGAKGLPQTDPREASVIFPVEVGLAALSIMLAGPDDMNLAEGGMGGMVTATANRMVTADTMVTLMRDRSKSSADDMDFEAEPITILAGQMSGSTMVMAVEDDMAEDMEELVLYGMTEGMEGEVTGEVNLYLWDAAVPALPVIAQLLLAAFLGIGGYRRYRRR